MGHHRRHLWWGLAGDLCSAILTGVMVLSTGHPTFTVVIVCLESGAVGVLFPGLMPFPCWGRLVLVRWHPACL